MSTLTIPQTVSRAASVQVVRSPGGLTAWLVEDYAVPLVALDVAFHGGSAQDPVGKAGTAAMMAALLVTSSADAGLFGSHGGRGSFGGWGSGGGHGSNGPREPFIMLLMSLSLGS